MHLLWRKSDQWPRCSWVPPLGAGPSGCWEWARWIGQQLSRSIMIWTAGGGKEKWGGKHGPKAKCKHLCSFKPINCKGLSRRRSVKIPTLHSSFINAACHFLIFIFAGLWPFYLPSVSFLPSLPFSFATFCSPLPPSLHSSIPSTPLCLFHYPSFSALKCNQFLLRHNGNLQKRLSQIVFLCPPFFLCLPLTHLSSHLFLLASYLHHLPALHCLRHTHTLSHTCTCEMLN